MFRVKFEDDGTLYEVGFQHWRPKRAFNTEQITPEQAATRLAKHNVLKGADASAYNGMTKAVIRQLGEDGVLVPVFEGVAHCFRTDAFRKEEGRRIALDRALAASEFDPDVAAAFWFCYHARVSALLCKDGAIRRDVITLPKLPDSVGPRDEAAPPAQAAS
jgi:hypothetical protein